jgi:predicted N-formylglutamate amidohydrolase
VNEATAARLDPAAWKITAVAIPGSLLAQLDATIVNGSLSSLATDLHASLDTPPTATRTREKRDHPHAASGAHAMAWLRGNA